jgi:hypothetical protein
MGFNKLYMSLGKHLLRVIRVLLGLCFLTISTHSNKLRTKYSNVNVLSDNIHVSLILLYLIFLGNICPFLCAFVCVCVCVCVCV